MQNRRPILEEHKQDFPALTPELVGLWVLGWHHTSPVWDEPIAAPSRAAFVSPNGGHLGLGTTRSSSPVVAQSKHRRECICWGGTGSTVVLRLGTVGCCRARGFTWRCPHSGRRMRWMEHIQPLEGSQAQGSELRAQHRAMGRDGLPCGAPSSANPVTSTEGFPGTNLKHILSTCPETKSAHPYGSRRMRLHLFIKYTISKRGGKKHSGGGVRSAKPLCPASNQRSAFGAQLWLWPGCRQVATALSGPQQPHSPQHYPWLSLWAMLGPQYPQTKCRD